MSFIDKGFLMNANLDTREVKNVEGRSISFYNTDKNISVLYMKLTFAQKGEPQNELQKDDVAGYKINITAIKPKTNQYRIVEGILTDDLVDESCAIWKFELDEEFTNQIGPVTCWTKIIDGDKVLNMNSFAYDVNADGLTGLNEEIVTDKDLPILEELIGKVQKVNNINDIKVSETETYSNKKIEEKFDGVNAQFNTKASKQELEIQSKRIDGFTNLAQGSTTGDAELIDGRVGADGKTYTNIGNSIRQQISKLNKNILYFKNGLETFDNYAMFDNGTLVYGQFKKDNIKRIASNDIMTFDRDINITVENGYRLTLCEFKNGIYVKDLAYVTSSYTLLKGTPVKAEIRLVDETSAIDNPNILEFLSKVTFTTKLEEKINKADYNTLLNKALVMNASKGIDTFGNHCTIELGTVDGGVVSYKKNRITSNDILHFDYDIELKIANGYRFGMSIMNSDGTYASWSGWQTGNYTIKANTYFKPLIAKVTEDDNLVDLIEMNNTVTFDNYIKQNSISSENSYKDSVELLPGGFGYPGTGTIYSGGYPTNRFVTKDIQIAPYDLVVGFKEPSANILYQVAFYQNNTNEVATNSDILFKEYRYEKCFIPKGTYFRLVYAMTGVTTSEQYNDVYKNLFIEKYEKINIAPVYNTLLPSSAKIAMHKGFYTKAPENSKASYLLAGKEPSVFAIEGDVQVTSDGKFVMYHAEDLSKLTNGSGAVITRTYDEVTSFTYDKVVNGLETYPSEKIISLEEYLKICKKYGKIALCELKFKDVDANNTIHFENFVKTLYKTGMQYSTIVISFTASELAKIQRIDPNIYVLLVLMSYDKFDYRLCGLVDNFGLDVNYESNSAGVGLTESQIEDAHSKGLTVGVWTVDDTSTKNNYIDYGVDLITTNTLA